MGTTGYGDSGVRSQRAALSAVERLLGPTFDLPDDAEVITRFGHYAAVLKVSEALGIAICTDGVGSKTIVASALDRYDTIGFDCVAMNVNDIICVGARPIALVDYLGVHTLDDGRTEQILRGLGAAARAAGIAVPGGEVAQLPEVIGSDGTVPGDDRAFDLVGTAIGVVDPARLITGATVEPGDAIVGFDSSGIHSNGLTLARRVLLRDGGYGLGDVLPDGTTLGDALLEPTRIYVRAVKALWDAGIDTRGLVHITGDGLANLCRLAAPVGYAIDDLPAPPPIFEFIRRTGAIDDAEMFRVFNMGVGFVAVVPEAQADETLEVARTSGYAARRIGRVDTNVGRVTIAPVGLEGGLADGESFFTRL